MAKKKSASYMTGGEQVAGTVLFVVYFAVLPLAAGPLFSAAEFLLGTSFSAAARSVITYYILFALSVIIFHNYLARTCRALADNLGMAFQSWWRCTVSTSSSTGSRTAWRATAPISTIPPSLPRWTPPPT